jgi:dTDP-glucose 4,6-dehydratase
MNILITGGSGFIGSHVIREALNDKQINGVVNLDALTYSGNQENLEDIANHEKYNFINGSINDKILLFRIINEYKINAIINLAAESHVDRSINSVEPFVKTNIDGTRVILECIRDKFIEGDNILFIQVSTDEVYGSLKSDDLPFTEENSLKPRNPYAVTKAASDMMVEAFVNTYGINAAITRCSNNYGSHQFPEKLIPLIIINSIEGKKLPIYGNGLQIRDWIHVKDHSRGILETLNALHNKNIKSGEVINFGASNEIKNIDIVKKIISITGADESQIEYVKDRPGHDIRYAMGYEKAKNTLNWEPRIEWEAGLESTVEWYMNNTGWINNIKDGSYKNWIFEHYG